MNRKLQLAIVTALTIANTSFIANLPANAEDPISAVVKGTLDLAAGIIKGTLDTAGNIVDASGHVVGHVVLTAANTTVDLTKVTLDSTGNVLDTSGQVVGHVVAGAVDTTLTATRYTLDATGAILDPTGSRVGYVVYNVPGRTYTYSTLSIDSSGRVIDTSGTIIGNVVYSSTIPTGPVYFTEYKVDATGLVRNASGDIVGTVEAGPAFSTLQVSTLRVDSLGNVIADTGNIVGRFMERVVAAPATTIAPAVTATVTEVPAVAVVSKYRVDVSGNVIDDTGTVVGFVAPTQTSRVIDYSAVTVDSEGKVFLAPGVSIGHVVIGSSATDLYVRRHNLETRINNEFTKGNITTAQADRLKAQLNASLVLENRYRRDGIISDREIRSLYTAWDHIMARLDSSLAMNARTAIGLRSK